MRSIVLALAPVAALTACAGAGSDVTVPPLTFLGDAVIDPTPAVAGDPEIGGLSSLSHIEGTVYYAISDDRGAEGPARYYVVDIEIDEHHGDESNGDPASPPRISASITGWHELFDADGQPLMERTYDLEGMAVLGRNLFISSEGDVSAGVEPFVAVFGPERRMMEPLGLPAGYVPNGDGTEGVRNNMAFESLVLTPDARYLFTATEGPLVQDGPPATPDSGALGRILRFDREHGVFDAQFVYPIDAVHASSPTGGLEVNGVAEMLALAPDQLLVLERSFVAGAEPEHSIKLFEVCLGGATDVSRTPSLASPAADFVPVRKKLIGDLAALVPRVDNIEGMSFGPRLSSGEQTLIFVSDNNFAPGRQITQILAFSLAAGAVGGC